MPQISGRILAIHPTTKYDGYLLSIDRHMFLDRRCHLPSAKAAVFTINQVWCSTTLQCQLGLLAHIRLLHYCSHSSGRLLYTRRQWDYLKMSIVNQPVAQTIDRVYVNDAPTHRLLGSERGYVDGQDRPQSDWRISSRGGSYFLNLHYITRVPIYAVCTVCLV